jgi:putative alpha-1,2-mannosidase
VTMHLGSPERTFSMKAPASSSLNKYVGSAALDGAAFDRTYLTQCDIHPGGQVDYSLGSSSAMSWGTAAGDAPPSVSDVAEAPALSACKAALGLR